MFFLRVPLDGAQESKEIAAFPKRCQSTSRFVDHVGMLQVFWLHMGRICRILSNQQEIHLVRLKRSITLAFSLCVVTIFNSFVQEINFLMYVSTYVRMSEI
jgi:hypothetical protein